MFGTVQKKAKSTSGKNSCSVVGPESTLQSGWPGDKLLHCEVQSELWLVGNDAPVAEEQRPPQTNSFEN